MAKHYEIKKIFFVRNFKSHIPYYIGMEIIGPHGGRYVVDEFNTEIILKRHYNTPVLEERTSNIMAKIGREKNNIYFVQWSGSSDEFINQSDGIKLIRKKGIEKAEIIGKNINI